MQATRAFLSPVQWTGLIKSVWRWRPGPGLRAAAIGLALAAAMAAGYLHARPEMTLIVNGRAHSFRTRQRVVRAILREAGLKLHPEDIVSPGLETTVQPGQTISVRLARPAVIEADSRVIELRTHSRTVDALLGEAGIRLRPHDRLTVNGRRVEHTAPLPDARPAKGGSVYIERLAEFTSKLAGPGRLGDDLTAVHIVVRRAVAVHVNDGGVPATLYTAAATVGEALQEENITVYLGDRVRPTLGTRISPGMHVFIRRSTPVTIQADGHTIKTRTSGQTVAEVLHREGVALLGEDYSQPAGEATVKDSMTIRVVRVKEALEVEQDPIPFETEWQADPTLEIDQRQLVQEGQNGVTKRRVRVRYEDGQEVWRAPEDEWIDRESSTKIIAYGTAIVERELDTPEGPVTYWRRVRMLATSYTAATSGKTRDHPYYGITAMGLQAGKGIVAVDPRVIPLGSELYVPGYGPCMAGDTGGGIKGRRIDLGYGEDDLVWWLKWVDVYVLSPPPPADKIRWVLPNWPRERK